MQIKTVLKTVIPTACVIIGVGAGTTYGLRGGPLSEQSVNGLKILFSSESLKLGEDNEIPINTQGRKIRRGFVSVSPYAADGDLMAPDSEDEAVVTERSAGGVFVRVVPVTAGKVHVVMSLVFADGTSDMASLDTEVKVSDDRPATVYLVRAGSDIGQWRGDMDIDVSNKSLKHGISLMATYQGGGKPVVIPDREVRFSTVVKPGSVTPIALNPTTGQVTGLAIGYALIVAEFRQMAAGICVDVRSDVQEGYNRVDCKDIDRGGVLLPKQSGEKQVPLPVVRPARNPGPQ